MVGIFSRLFKKEKVFETVEEKISFEEARVRYLQRYEDAKRIEKEKFFALKQKLEAALQSTTNAFEALQNASVAEPAAVNSQKIKNAFCDRILGLMRSVRLEDNYSKTVEDIHRILGLVTVGPSEAAHLKFFFEKELAEIAEELKQLTFLSSQLDAIGTDANENIVSVIDNIDKEIFGRFKESDLMKEEISGLERNLEVEKSVTITGAELDKQKLASVAREIRNIEAEIYNTFNPLLRILDERADSLPEKTLQMKAKEYSEQPLQAFLSDSDDCIFRISDYLKGNPRIDSFVMNKKNILVARGRLGELYNQRSSTEAFIMSKDEARFSRDSGISVQEKKIASARKKLNECNAHIAELREKKAKLLQRLCDNLGTEQRRVMIFEAEQ